jgi:DNA-binding response OmpR family regulator
MEPGVKPGVVIVTADAVRGLALAAYLDERELDATCETRGDEAFAALGTRTPDAVLIDDQAPRMAGREFCRAARDAGHAFAIVVMARSDDLLDQVLCLEMGADDYVPADAPCRLLWTRLKVVLRRVLPPPRAPEATALRCGGFLFDRAAMCMRAGGGEVPLTPAEAACLGLLIQRAGSVVTREELHATLGPAPRDPASRAVDTQIFRLRRKLEGVEPGANRIRSVRPIGYLLAP